MYVCHQTRKYDQNHLKFAFHRTHTVVYTVCSFPFHGLQHTKDKITTLKYNNRIKNPKKPKLGFLGFLGF